MKDLYKDREELNMPKADLTKKRFKSGATSTKGHRYELLPSKGLACAADRFELGLFKHRDTAYNNLCNQLPLADREWLTERLSHCIQHCLNAIVKLNQHTIVGNEDIDTSIYEDAGAIAFCGLVLGEAFYQGYHEKQPDQISEDKG